MDDNEQLLHEGFSQDECIEWEENGNVDLRALARSPHVYSGALLLSTQHSSAKAPPARRKSPRPPPSDICKNLNYSPNQEIAHLLEKQPASMHQASTQPRENTMPKTTENLGMRHSRRRRDSALSKQQPKRLKRSNTEPIKGRRRPQSAEPRSASDQPFVRAPFSNSIDAGIMVDFEDLLKDLDQSRNPSHVSKVNNSGKTTVNNPIANKIAAAPNAPKAVTATKGPAALSTCIRNPPPNAENVPNYSTTHATSSHPQQFHNISHPQKQTCLAPVAKPLTAQSGQSHVNTVIANNNNTTTATPAIKATTMVTSSFFLGDDLKLSEEDWAQMDALMTQATTKGNRYPPVSTTNHQTDAARNAQDEAFSTKDWKAIQAIDESLARARGHAPTASNAQQPRHDETTDEFGDLPMIDFDAMDQQIAQRATTTTIPEPFLVVRNPVSPSFDPQTCFIAFTRYKVVGTPQVDNKTYTKTLYLKEWSTTMLKDDTKQSMHHASSSVGERSEMDDEEECRPDGHVLLRGEWYHTHVDKGDVIHLCSLSGKYRTDVGALPIILHTCPPEGSDLDDDLLLVVHPDLLIPPTTISETVTCSRRAVLRMRLGSSGISCKLHVFFAFTMCICHSHSSILLFVQPRQLCLVPCVTNYLKDA